ncbi:hypothetical protein M2272_005760 [Mycobacterium frederiksbergense]|uniref:Uncharacterized protein n=1 Tax=Mycolicibacterium frederiksbergense TaxID=117567 RepID=A0ABT6L812_9MYCO|nr:hypothetical protein [Mycolicibacterium frederiksbergense]MDH6199093.1 hypothetical protein [Mycolicibacterium frederiksbergense]
MKVQRTIYPLLDRDVARMTPFSYVSQAFREHTDVPIEGVGVVHVVTEVTDGNPRFGFTDVTLARYRDGELIPPVPVAGSVCESPVAHCMHEHWCDLERLIRCIQGDTKTLFILDIDWEIDDDEEPMQSSGESPTPDPGLTPRILEIAELAENTPVESIHRG